MFFAPSNKLSINLHSAAENFIFVFPISNSCLSYFIISFHWAFPIYQLIIQTHIGPKQLSGNVNDIFHVALYLYIHPRNTVFYNVVSMVHWDPDLSVCRSSNARTFSSTLLFPQGKNSSSFLSPRAVICCTFLRPFPLNAGRISTVVRATLPPRSNYIYTRLDTLSPCWLRKDFLIFLPIHASGH